MFAGSGFPGCPVDRLRFVHMQRRRGRPNGKHPRTASYLLRLRPVEKRELERLAQRRGVTLADALRDGARAYLDSERNAA